jgi:hypothetical protein
MHPATAQEFSIVWAGDFVEHEYRLEQPPEGALPRI